MFTLITGLPGSGKTSHLIAKLKDETRPVYYRGIRGLKLPWTELSDDEARAWPEHLPEGAILVIDEAQQLWPVRASSKPVPDGLTALETHRHHGWDVYFITQDPTLLDSHARKIANEQFHYVRPFGAPFVVEYHSGTGYVNPSNRIDLQRCSQKKKRLPKEVWGLYESAEIHTHRFRPPKILYMLAVILVGSGFAWYHVFATGFGQDQFAPEVEHVPDAPAMPVPQRQHEPSGRAEQIRVEWVRAFQSEVPGLPFTAPIYAEAARQVKAVPVVHGCMSFRADMSDCRCYTQQGTRIRDMRLSACKLALTDGVFNHLQEDERPARARGAGEGRDAPAPSADIAFRDDRPL